MERVTGLGKRLYTPFDLALKTIKIRGTLEVLVQKPEMYNPRAEMTREMSHCSGYEMRLSFWCRCSALKVR